jgi:CRISPR-associated protein Cas4
MGLARLLLRTEGDAHMATTPRQLASTAGVETGTAGYRGPLELPEYLPARMLNEFVYCPRLFFYKWVEGVFAHSADTVEGALRHEKLERKADALPPAEETTEGATIHSRSVELSSETRKLIAKIDLVEGSGGEVSPVDYKKGAPRDGAEGPEAWPADRAQVCVQALILRDNGYACGGAVVYYSATKQRVRVPIDDALVDETIRNDHHIVFRSAGGGDELANRTTLCAWHHLRGVHAGVVRCAGAAPDALRFELGVRGLLPPLMSFAPGERLVRAAALQ